MADPIRYEIITALKALLEAITVANGFRRTITKVEIGAKDFGHATVNKDTIPWVGIVPMQEKITDKPFGSNTIDWPIQILTHYSFDTATDLGLAIASQEHYNDIRKALYEDPTLGVEGVHLLGVTGRLGSEGSEEAVRMLRGSLWIEIFVRFSEDVDEA